MDTIKYLKKSLHMMAYLILMLVSIIYAQEKHDNRYISYTLNKYKELIPTIYEYSKGQGDLKNDSLLAVVWTETIAIVDNYRWAKYVLLKLEMRYTKKITFDLYYNYSKAKKEYYNWKNE